MQKQLRPKKSIPRYSASRAEKLKLLWPALFMLNILLLIMLTLILIPEKAHMKKHADPEVVALFKTLTNILNNEDINTPLNTIVTRSNSKESQDKIQIMKWLKVNWQLYGLNDTDLPIAIEDLCQPIYESDLLNYQQAMLPCTNHQLISHLREQARTYSPPFQHSGREVRISVPEKVKQPPPGFAYTCFEGELTNRKATLFGHNYHNSFAVQLVGAYDCTGKNTSPDIQLNEKQALSLFKHTARAIEYSIVLIK